MKYVGLLLIAGGIALLIIIVYNILTATNETISPIPENKGVKVIPLSPKP